MLRRDQHLELSSVHSEELTIKVKAVRLLDDLELSLTCLTVQGVAGHTLPQPGDRTPAINGKDVMVRMEALPAFLRLIGHGVALACRTSGYLVRIAGHKNLTTTPYKKQPGGHCGAVHHAVILLLVKGALAAYPVHGLNVTRVAYSRVPGGVGSVAIAGFATLEFFTGWRRRYRGAI